MSKAIQKVAVLGAGTMGHGIAQVAASSQCDVHLFDISNDALENAKVHGTKNLDKGVEKGKLTTENKTATLSALTFTDNLGQAVSTADVVIEAAPEKLELKCSIFKEVSAKAPKHCILGTNTSSLSVTEIAAASSDPSRVVGMHFFNPPYILKLLELVRAEQTSDETLEQAKCAGEKLGRDMVVINDSPGFATSRLGLVLGLEAVRMVQEGVAKAEDIDRAMELGYRHPMGPLKLTDLVGLDVRLAIAEYLHRELGTAQFHPPQLLRKMVRAGKLGKKSGQGFYSW
jgi:3-hydroxybutyryl-CoA dehydrogenase